MGFLTSRSRTGKWLFKLHTEDAVWQNLLMKKYIGSSALSRVYWKPGNSHFSAVLMATKIFFPYGSSSIKDGSEIRFTEDKWIGHAMLREQYSALYNIICHKTDTLRV
jgi:hypothetical protein